MFHRSVLSLTSFFLLAGMVATADAQKKEKKQDKNILVTDPADADHQYQVQGEYLGSVMVGDRKFHIGAQVIALGGDEYDAKFYLGGLPGEGWNRGDKSDAIKAKTNAETGVTEFKNEKMTAVISDKEGKWIAFERDGVKAELKKVHRKSKTLGAKAPEGAIVLFDGSNADHFQGGKVNDKGFLMAGTETKEKFQDFKLHLEFRTPFKPFARGQARGNSGVYAQNRYEIQVLDSFGLEGKNNECGGIYSISVPKVNACFPPLSWQTYDIDFTAAKYDADGKKTENARVTVKHNDIVIHDDLELTHGTPGKNKEAATPDGIYLQGHGNPVVYRNIWIVKK